MKNFSIHSLALVVMTVVVCASSLNQVNEKDMLHLIYEAAKNMSRDINKMPSVAKASGHQTRCVKHFFCRAEKALNGIELKDYHLTRLLHQYNKQINDTTCDNPHVMITMEAFLNDTMICSARAKKPKTN